MPDWLTKQYGPFTGTVWVVVIVGGVGLGLLMRRYLGNRGAETSAISETTGGGAMVESPAVSPAFVGGGTLYNQGEIVAEVIAALKDQTPAPPTTTPGPTVTPGPMGDPVKLRAEISRLQTERNALIADRNALATAPDNSAKGLTGTALTQYRTLTNKINELATRIYALDAQLQYLKGAS